MTQPVQTPNAAKQYAHAVFDACYNDEIRAIVAWELLRRMESVTGDDAVCKAYRSAWVSMTQLVSSFDRQFQD